MHFRRDDPRENEPRAQQTIESFDDLAQQSESDSGDEGMVNTSPQAVTIHVQPMSDEEQNMDTGQGREFVDSDAPDSLDG